MSEKSTGSARPAFRDERAIARRLSGEVGLSFAEAEFYLKILTAGSISVKSKGPETERLERAGMVILSGNGKEFIPVHPRLAVANSYRTWRENIVRGINERRMRIDKLILELIPVYEAATEKRASTKGG